jgi:hypothetical protein
MTGWSAQVLTMSFLVVQIQPYWIKGLHQKGTEKGQHYLLAKVEKTKTKTKAKEASQGFSKLCLSVFHQGKNN